MPIAERFKEGTRSRDIDGKAQNRQTELLDWYEDTMLRQNVYYIHGEQQQHYPPYCIDVTQ